MRHLPLLWIACALWPPCRAAEPDTFLPWEGGASYYAKWGRNRLARPDSFPISVWLQNPSRAREYRDIGVNQFVGLWRGPTEEQLTALREAGMTAFCEQTPRALASQSRGVIQGWALMDEPDNAQAKPGGGWGSCVLPPAIVSQYRELRNTDRTRPVLLNLGQAVANEAWPGRGEVCSGHDEHYSEYAEGADILSYDVYPINDRLPLWYVGKGIDRLRKWAGYRKPVWNWIETTSISGGPKPTPAQVEAEVWMSIIHGSMGIGYFCHSFKPTERDAALLDDAGMRRGVKAINENIAALAAVLNTPSIANGVAVSSSNENSPVEWMLKRHGGATYLFAVGARPGGPATATFRLRDCPADLKVQVLGESRTVEVAAGVFRDRFSDYQVHIYKVPWVPAVK